uniref:Uncharacterized protein n=1 Tax=Megaselia scalaris TaxID=36166 RepID=T1GS05_MEGSC
MDDCVISKALLSFCDIALIVETSIDHVLVAFDAMGGGQDPFLSMMEPPQLWIYLSYPLLILTMYLAAPSSAFSPRITRPPFMTIPPSFGKPSIPTRCIKFDFRIYADQINHNIPNPIIHNTICSAINHIHEDSVRTAMAMSKDNRVLGARFE